MCHPDELHLSLPPLSWAVSVGSTGGGVLRLPPPSSFPGTHPQHIQTLLFGSSVEEKTGWQPIKWSEQERKRKNRKAADKGKFSCQQRANETDHGDFSCSQRGTPELFGPWQPLLKNTVDLDLCVPVCSWREEAAL